MRAAKRSGYLNPCPTSLLGLELSRAPTGGGTVRANLSQVIIGNTNRATESRHATGAESEIPISASTPAAGRTISRAWDPQAKEITARGRTFLLGVPRTSRT